MAARSATATPESASAASDVEPSVRVVRSPLARLPLAAASAAYALVARARNALYDRGLLRSRSVPARVVSIGNVVAGGTGKTPVVAHLAREAARRGRRVAIVSRGYGRRPGDAWNDENRVLSVSVPEAILVEDSDRAAGARRAIGLGADLVLLDDGFQHRRLRRDADVVLVDATRDLDDERCLPLGFLREPLSPALRRATVALLTRTELAPPQRVAAIRLAVARDCERVALAETTVAGFRRLGGAPLGGAAGERSFLFAGVGNPAAFRRTAERAGVRVAGFRAYRDHHAYAARDLDRLAEEATKAGAERLLTTAKDAVKLDGLARPGGLPIDVLDIGVRFVSGEDEILRVVLGEPVPST